MNIQQQWAIGKATDDQALNETDKLAGTQKGRNLLILTGGYQVHKFDYQKVMSNPTFDIMSMNFGYLLPGSENFRWMFHGSIGYVKLHAGGSVLFKYFCRAFKGTQVFMVATRHNVGGLYPIPNKDLVTKTIHNNGIKSFQIITHAYAKKGLGYVPTSLKHYTPSKIPYGCGGTLNAMALPFALQLGYEKIFMVGVGDHDLRHYYDLTYVQPHLHKPVTLPHRATILKRYAHLRALGEKNGTKIIVTPRSLTEKSILDIFPSIERL